MRRGEVCEGEAAACHGEHAPPPILEGGIGREAEDVEREDEGGDEEEAVDDHPVAVLHGLRVHDLAFELGEDRRDPHAAEDTEEDRVRGVVLDEARGEVEERPRVQEPDGREQRQPGRALCCELREERVQVQRLQLRREPAVPAPGPANGFVCESGAAGAGGFV